MWYGTTINGTGRDGTVQERQKQIVSGIRRLILWFMLQMLGYFVICLRRLTKRSIHTGQQVGTDTKSCFIRLSWFTRQGLYGSYGSCGAAGGEGEDTRPQLLRARHPEQRFSRIVLCSDMVMPFHLSSAPRFFTFAQLTTFVHLITLCLSVGLPQIDDLSLRGA